MGHAEALAKKPADDEDYFKRLARDILVSFSRMRYAEQLTPAQLRAHHVDPDMGMEVSQAIGRIEQTASQYSKGLIKLGDAAGQLEKAIPPMMRFMIHEITDGGEGQLRVLPENVDDALHAYYKRPDIDNAYQLVVACVNDPVINTHWLFDNLARAVLFCDHARHHGKEQAQERAA